MDKSPERQEGFDISKLKQDNVKIEPPENSKKWHSSTDTLQLIEKTLCSNPFHKGGILKGSESLKAVKYKIIQNLGGYETKHNNPKSNSTYFYITLGKGNDCKIVGEINLSKDGKDKKLKNEESSNYNWIEIAPNKFKFFQKTEEKKALLIIEFENQ